MQAQIKSIMSFALRLGLSALLLGWLFSRIDFRHMLEAMRGADIGMLIVAGCVFISTTVLILWRWRLLMKALGLSVSRFDACRWFLIGQFCNLFLPSSVGGDVVKGLGLAGITGNKPKTFASIVLDRLSGFVGIVITAILASFFGGHLLDDRSVILSIVAMAVLSLVAAIIFFSQRIFTWICGLFSFWPSVKQGLLHLHDDFLLLRGQGLKAAESVLISVFAQLVLACTFYLTALAMHQQIDLLYFIIFSPIVCVATTLPSIGGLGIREVGWVYLLSKIGVHQGVALGLSLMNFAFMLIVGLLGGLFYVTTMSHRRV